MRARDVRDKFKAHGYEYATVMCLEQIAEEMTAREQQLKEMAQMLNMMATIVSNMTTVGENMKKTIEQVNTKYERDPDEMN